MDLFDWYSMHPHSGALNFSYFVFEKDNIFLGMVLITLFDLKVVGCSCNLLLRFLLHFNFTLWCYLYKYNFFFTNYSYLEICDWVPSILISLVFTFPHHSSLCKRMYFTGCISVNQVFHKFEFTFLILCSLTMLVFF